MAKQTPKQKAGKAWGDAPKATPKEMAGKAWGKGVTAPGKKGK